MLSACTTLAPEPSAPRADEILAEALAAARQPAAEQRRLVGEARQAYEREPDHAARLRYGALLVVLPPPLRDDQQALKVLEPVKASRDQPLAATLAALLVDHASDRRRLEQQVQEQSRASRSAGERATRAEAERARAENEREALMKQLEALKAAERRILEREEKGERRARR